MDTYIRTYMYVDICTYVLRYKHKIIDLNYFNIKLHKNIWKFTCTNTHPLTYKSLSSFWKISLYTGSLSRLSTCLHPSSCSASGNMYMLSLIICMIIISKIYMCLYIPIDPLPSPSKPSNIRNVDICKSRFKYFAKKT